MSNWNRQKMVEEVFFETEDVIEIVESLAYGVFKNMNRLRDVVVTAYDDDDLETMIIAKAKVSEIGLHQFKSACNDFNTFMGWFIEEENETGENQ